MVLAWYYAVDTDTNLSSLLMSWLLRLGLARLWARPNVRRVAARLLVKMAVARELAKRPDHRCRGKVGNQNCEPAVAFHCGSTPIVEVAAALTDAVESLQAHAQSV